LKAKIESIGLEKVMARMKKMILSVLQFLLLIGIAFVILGPIITVVSRSFFAPSDVYNPTAYLLPLKGTFQNYKLVFIRMNYIGTLLSTLGFIVLLALIQVLVCSMVGYGFARFEFPFKKLLFGCVIVTIVIPTHTIMLPLYMHFRNFDLLGMMTLIKGGPINLLSTRAPIVIMTCLGSGLRSGLYIYIFTQFFRGLPKEIEEAAFIDGAGSWYTYFRIMLVNAVPSVLTVAVFSLVWQYNDMFYSKLFSVHSSKLISLRVSTVQATIEFMDLVKDPMLSQLYLYAAIVLTIIPILIIYLVLQKYFMEGVERSGITG